MNKDVIHINTEDDITTIINKIKSSKDRIIALVPPRRIGVLQSAVNVRLLAKAADAADKRVVIITNDTVLAGLAATAKIPVAKTLQSKPELADIPVVKIDDDDVIDGGQLSVGDMADSANRNKSADGAIDKAIAADTVAAKRDASQKSGKKTPKVPNFNIFRKKFVLIGGGVLVLIVFLVWAIWFAPHATVIISAKTTDTTVNDTVQLAVDGTTDIGNKTVRAIKKEVSKEISIEFAATGKKNVGEKATGTVVFKNSSPSSVTIAAGTVVKSSGLSYSLSSSVTVPAATLGWSCPGRTCAGTATGSIVAAEGGSQYNAASGDMSISVDSVSASLRSATSGGTDKTATVVTQGDINNAKAKLNDQKADGMKDQLAKSFDGSVKVISDSYVEVRSEPASTVAVDAEATGNVTLKSTITSSMLALEKSELKQFSEAKIKEELSGKKSQKIYDNGVDQATFSQFAKTDSSQMVKITIQGKVGPEIKEDQVKEQAKGHTYGDVQSAIESIEGVEDVDIKFSQFWVRSVPNDVHKINVEFKLKNAK